MEGTVVNLWVTGVRAIRSGRLIHFWEESPVLHKQSLNIEIEDIRTTVMCYSSSIKQVVTQNLDAVIAETNLAIAKVNQPKNEIEEELTALQKQYDTM